MIASISNGDTYEVTEFKQIDDTSYYAFFDEMRASQFGKAITFKMVEGDNTVSNTLCYSVESYAAVYKTDAEVGSVASSMMKYGKAANNFNQVD